MKKTLFIFLFCFSVAGVSADIPAAQGKPWRVRAITLSGNRTFKRSELLALLDLQPALFKKRPRYSKGRLNSDIESLILFYRNQGFLQVAVEGRVARRDTLRKRVFLDFSVEEGVRTTITSVIYRHPPDSTLSKKLKCRVGKPLVFSAIAIDEKTLRSTRARKGYIHAVTTSSLSIDTAAAEATITFSTTDGPKVVVDSIVLLGLKKCKPKVVSRELRFAAGDTLSLAAIRASEMQLYKTGLFNSVYIEPGTDSTGNAADDTLPAVSRPVTVSVREADFFRLKLGIGYGNEDGARGSFETSYYNFFRSGHRGTLKGNASWKIQQIQSTYSTPWFLGIPLKFDVSLYYNRFNDKVKFRGSFWGTLLSLEHSFSEISTAQLWTKFEDVLWINTDNLPGEFPRNNTQSFGVDFTFDTRNDLLNPATGVYSLIKGEVAGLAGINSNQFVKFTADNRLYWKMGPFSCGSALKLGWANPYGKSTQVPIQDQFFAGGSRSVRGFKENFLSTYFDTTDSAWHAKSGRAMLTANLLEVRFPILWWINGAVFADAGILHDNFLAVTMPTLLKEISWTAGPGLRVNTPLAIIRFDLGFKLNKKPEESLTQWHLDVGQSF